MSAPLRVLIVEDSEADCQLIVRELRRGGYEPEFRRVDTADQFAEAVAAGGWDIVLSDYHLPGYSGPAALRTLRQGGSDLPCIIVSGAIGEDAAVSTIRDGADDYVMKDHLVRLPLAVAQHLAKTVARRERRRMEDEVRRSNAELAALQAIAVAVNRSLDLHTVLETALAETVRVLHADGGAILLSERAGERQHCIVQWNCAAQALACVAEILDEGVPATGSTEARLVMPGDRPTTGCRGLAALGWSSLVTVRLQSRHGGDSTLVVGSQRRDAFTPAILPLAEGIGSQISMAVENARLFEETRRLRAFNESIVQGVAEALFLRDDRGVLTFMNPAAESLLGCSAEKLKGRRWEQLMAEEEQTTPGQSDPASSRTAARYETELRDGEGRSIPVIVSTSPLQLEGRSVGILSACTDISDRVRTERLLEAQNRAALAMARAMTREEIYAAVARECTAIGCPSILLLFDAERQALRVAHLSYDEGTIEAARAVTGRSLDDIAIPIHAIREEWQRLCRRETIVVDSGATMIHEAVPGLDADQAGGLARVLGLSGCIAAPLAADSRVMGVLLMTSSCLRDRDVPAISALANQIAAAWYKNDLLEELHTNLQELKKVQGQLVHAQKMEAVGRLAGGIAHDFNNQLMVIMGSAEMLLEKSGGDGRLRDEIDEIMNTAERSAQLTQHLLAFSRRQACQPVSLDPRLLIGNMERMLRRLIGEDIGLVLELAPQTGWIHADPGQVEQVIMNLVVNARDAMSHGGKLVIATANADFAQPTVIGRTEIPRGMFVALSVRDNGTGIDDEAMEHLFEPFFTTKPAGVGTGLGLAIVYGIVRQSGGAITVDSTRGGGATFTVYLPRIEAPSAEPSPKRPTPAPRGAGEDILLVEDELPLNGMIRQSLENNGYRVAAAATGDEAVAIAEREGGSLSLLLTDLFMPGTVNRRQMIDRIVQRCPGIKVILMSGYTDEVIAPLGVLKPGRAMLTKPFSMARLLEQVRITLDDLETPP